MSIRGGARLTCRRARDDDVSALEGMECVSVKQKSSEFNRLIFNVFSIFSRVNRQNYLS